MFLLSPFLSSTFFEKKSSRFIVESVLFHLNLFKNIFPLSRTPLE
nr:MAG TPA: hypothetical protein [Caudoviricetes sp.]